MSDNLALDEYRESMSALRLRPFNIFRYRRKKSGKRITIVNGEARSDPEKVKQIRGPQIHHKWFGCDEETMRKYYGSMTVREIQKLLVQRFTLQAIMDHASKMKLTSKRKRGNA